MKNIKIIINDIEQDLNDLDTEYRESLANALVKLHYFDDTPLKLSLGNEYQQQMLERVYNAPLKANQLENIILFISNEMKHDFQYGAFKLKQKYYLKITEEMKMIERGDKRR